MNMTLAERLMPELEVELAKTRKVLTAVPDGRNEFKPHEKSMLLLRLAGHVAELAGFAYYMLTRDGIDMGTPEDPRKILRMTTKAELLAEFEPMATQLIETLKTITDESFDESFTLSRQGVPIIVTTRYAAYRNICLDHMIHHRAQLGVYLRLLDVPVPATYGPSADEK
jgi:uncharacterized damage-inducible protein DinB